MANPLKRSRAKVVKMGERRHQAYRKAPHVDVVAVPRCRIIALKPKAVHGFWHRLFWG